jgi:hypothetical protein
VTLSAALGAAAQERFATLPLDSRVPAAWVTTHGRPLGLETRRASVEWAADMASAHELTGLSAWLTVPVSDEEEVLGALVAGWRDERAFPADEVELVQAFAAQCAQALGRLQRLEAERHATAQAVAMAETLQRSLLTAPPQPDHAQVVVRYLPATEAAQVGGDWYDAFLQPSGTTMIVIGDVAGHDTSAAATMGQLRSLLRGIAVHSGSGPAEVLRGLDAAMQVLEVDTLATAAIARFEQTPTNSGAASPAWSGPTQATPHPWSCTPTAPSTCWLRARRTSCWGWTPPPPAPSR